MNPITVKRDPGLTKPELSVLHNTEQEKDTRIDQTKVFGTLVPLISIDGIAIDFHEIRTLSIDNSPTSKLPSCSFSFNDSKGLFKNYHTNPSYIQVIIIPPFDNAYKKINLVFDIAKFNVDGSEIDGSGTYRCNELYDTAFECLGSDVSTYNLFDTISEKTKLGFAGNIESSEDKRFINIAHKSYLDTLNFEIGKSIANENTVLDYWVDYWDYINLCNIFNLYEVTGSGDNVNNPAELTKVWVASNVNAVTTTEEVTPMQVECTFTNHPALSSTELIIKNYELITNNTKYKSAGTSRVISIYNNGTKEWVDHTIEIKDDIAPSESSKIKDKENIKTAKKTTFEYTGEQYEEYDAYFSGIARDTYMRKISKKIHKFTLTKPILGLLRGDTFEVIYFENDSIKTAYEEGSKELKQHSGNNNLPKSEDLTKNEEVSGKFKVIGTSIHFDNVDGFEFEVYSIKI